MIDFSGSNGVGSKGVEADQDARAGQLTIFFSAGWKTPHSADLIAHLVSWLVS